MARSTEDIFDLMVIDKEADPNLDVFDSGSQVSAWRNFLFVVAASMNLFEQLLDLLTADVTEIALGNKIGTCTWLRGEALKFQFDVSDPQVIELIDFIPSYPVFDASKQIITAAAVTEGGNSKITVKVAKGTPPDLTALDPGELTAFIDYIDAIHFAGTQVIIASANADRIKITVEVFYSGQVGSATTKANVITAIDNFGATFTEEEFNGVLLVAKLEDAIQAAVGVEDLEVTQLLGRPSTVPLVSAVIFTRKYTTGAGYFITEDTAGSTIDDTLTLTLFTDV